MPLRSISNVPAVVRTDMWRLTAGPNIQKSVLQRVGASLRRRRTKQMPSMQCQLCNDHHQQTHQHLTGILTLALQNTSPLIVISLKLSKNSAIHVRSLQQKAPLSWELESAILRSQQLPAMASTFYNLTMSYMRQRWTLISCLQLPLKVLGFGTIVWYIWEKTMYKNWRRWQQGSSWTKTPALEYAVSVWKDDRLANHLMNHQTRSTNPWISFTVI